MLTEEQERELHRLIISLKNNIDYLIETKQFYKLFPRSYSFQEYFKKLTEEELKEHITISVLMNFDFFDYSDANVKLIKELESDTVKDIRIFCSSYLPMNEIIYKFKDDRVKANSYDCYKPYLNVDAID